MTGKRLLPAAILLIIVLPSILIYNWTQKQLNDKIAGDFKEIVDFNIKPGMSVYQIGAKLQEQELIVDSKKFKWATKILRAETKIQPGVFYIPRGKSNKEIIELLLAPGINTKNVTIPEGLTVKSIASILKRELDIDSLEFVELCEDSVFTRSVGIESNRLEGYLYPSTYNFFNNSSAEQCIKRMVDQFLKTFNKDLVKASRELKFSIHEVVTLASIIQGEVMVWDEASKVSAVYHNRLKRGIRLAADPTIQYIIPGPPKRLLNEDLAIRSPYNTYRRKGLPPGPINNPGKRALHTAVSPADVDFIYFVAKGDGTHYFNTTEEAHNRDKKKLQRLRWKVAREKRRNGK